MRAGRSSSGPDCAPRGMFLLPSPSRSLPASLGGKGHGVALVLPIAATRTLCRRRAVPAPEAAAGLEADISRSARSSASSRFSESQCATPS